MNLLNIFLIIFLIFLFIVLNYQFWHSTQFVSTEQFANYWHMLAGLGLLAGIITIYMEYRKDLEIKAKEREEVSLQQTNTYWIELEKYMAQATPYLDRLYKQMYSQNKTIREPPYQFDENDEDKRRMYEIHTCSILFEIIENILTAVSSLKEEDLIDWLETWQSWFRSPIVRGQWKYMGSNFNKDTRKFIETCLLVQNPMSQKGKCRDYIKSLFVGGGT